MRLKLLGTGAAEGIPALFCNCPICTNARRRRGREVRQNSCAVVESAGGASLLIDAPPHIKMTIDSRAVDQERLEAILITHAHQDHSLGLDTLSDHAVSGGGFQDPHVVDLWAPPSVFAFMERVRGARIEAVEGDSVFRPRTARALEPFAAASFTITPLETGHRAGGECLGYVIQEPSCTLAYMLDSPAQPPDRTLEHLLACRIDCLVFDCTYASSHDPGGHSDIEGLVAMHQRLQPGLTVASHISHRCLDHHALAQRLRPYGILPGFDGMVLRVGRA
jgi:phosphoribosyl 1,2-cyclic phosphate phosphodiesterase